MSGTSRFRSRQGAAPVRVMVVDDSIVARSIIQSIVAPLPDFEVVAGLSTAEQALATLDVTEVDIVVLDLELPGMDGLTALPEILRRDRAIRVLVVSASVEHGAAGCVRALTLGASDTLEKPRPGSIDGAFRQQLTDKLRRLGADVPRREPGPSAPAAPAPAPPTPLRLPVAGPIGCIAIGSSTGGLHALSAFFRALPATVVAPIVITQHLPDAFMSYFAAQMATITRRPAAVARDGERLRPGSILIAPGTAHLGLRRVGGEVCVALGTAPAPSGCLPSVDPMFEATAALFGHTAFAVVLTGMGRDGSIGARRIVEMGGEVVAQDRRTSVVWGMPGSVARAGLATLIDEPAVLAGRIAARLAEPSLRVSSL